MALLGDSLFFGTGSMDFFTSGDSRGFLSGLTKGINTTAGEAAGTILGGTSFTTLSSSFFMGLSRPFISDMMAFRSMSFPHGLDSSSSFSSSFLTSTTWGLTLFSFAGGFSTKEPEVVEGSGVGVEDADEVERVFVRLSTLSRVLDFSDPVSPSDSYSSLSLSAGSATEIRNF